MNIYTYVVNHGNKTPSVGAGTIINGGKVEGLMFADAITKLNEAEEFMDKLRDETTDDQTKYAIDDFRN